jgi:hypothetical protein
MIKPITELSNFELLDEFEEMVKYWHYDVGFKTRPSEYTVDMLRSELEDRLITLNSFINPTN